MEFNLRLIYTSDMEGGQRGTDGSYSSAVNFAAITEALKDGASANLLLSAGDNYIPGPFYNAGGIRSAIRDSGLLNDVYNQLFGLSENGYDSLRELPGVVDIAIMNAIGFDASAVGNHEFDAGPSAFEDLIAENARDPEGPAGDRYVGTLFPYLSANLDFSGDSGLAGLFDNGIIDATGGVAARTIAPAVTFELTDDDGDTSRVGVIGATTPILSTISSPGGVIARGTGGLDFYPQTPEEYERVVNDLANVLQPVIDAVISEGVDKVLMVTHLQQSEMEQRLIQRLRGVDVMIAGGSGSSFFDDGSTPSTDDDLFSTRNADGNPAYVISVPGSYSTVGVIDLEFDDNGIPSIVQARGYETTPANVDLVGGNLNGEAASLVAELTETVRDVVSERDQIIYGYTNTYLQGNRGFIRTEETNFGNLAADAQLWKARQIDPEISVSLKNGGGLRAPIGDIGGTAANPTLLPPRQRTIEQDGYFKPAGAISQLDLENTLKFNNDLVVVETTASGLQALMEHAVSASATGNTPGQFPQIGGMRLQFDYEQDYSDAPGIQRIRSLVITGENDSIIDVVIQDGVLQGNPDRPIKMVTLDFLANNDGDSYPFSDVASSITSLQINGGDVSEQVALAEYLQAFYGTPETAFNIAETSVENDLRIINNGRGNRNTILNDAPIGSVDLGGSEISSYASDHEVALVITGGTDFQVVDLSDPTNPRSIADINLGAPAQSVDVVGDLVAVAVADPDNEDTANGNVVFFQLQGSGGQTEATRIGEIEVGALPDSLKFSSDGRRLVVANEAQSIDVPDPVNNDAAGSISVIDTSSYATTGSIAGFTVNTIDFLDFNGQEVKLNLQGIRIRNTDESGSVAQDIEPEFVAVLGNRAWISLQENNALAEVDLTTNELVDIWSLGIKDWKRGTPVATNLPFEIAYPGDQLDRGSNGRLDPGEVVAGGLSGAWFDGTVDGVDQYYVVTDRGPQAFDIGDRPGDNPNDPNSGEKVFDDPDYPITVYKLARTANGLNQVERITLKVPDGAGGFRNATGIGALPAHDPAYTKVGVDADGFNVYEEVARDAFGIDAESILVISIDGLNNGQPMFAISEEYFPGIYLFDQASGELVQRIVPEGSDFSAVSYEPGRGDSAEFTLQTLPSHYSDRRNNRGFEGMAFNPDDGLLYAFIQSPMEPDGYTNGSGEFIRILAVDPSTGQAQAEYLHLLSDEAEMDKIGDAVYDASTGRFLIIERDSNLGSASNKAIIEIDLSGATNVLGFTTQDGGWSELIGVEQPETLPTESIADSLAQVGVVFANRVELINLPSIGADSRFDKPEGLALKDDGSLVIFNDNDFVNVAGRPDNLATEINFIPQPLDTSNRDEAGGAFGVKNLYGIPMPDGIAAYQSNGNTYIIATGEGDDRDGDGDLNDAERARDVAGVDNNDIGDRLKLVITEGDYNGDGAIDQPYAFGSRSFRIYDDGGNLIFDSGNQLDEIAKAYGVYDDGRSDDKGMEPEAVTTQTIDGEVYAFIGLERAENSTVLVYNVTDPLNSRFTQVLINPAMTTTVDGEEVIEVAESWGPESLTFIQTRANGEGILMVANEGDDYSEESQLDFYSIPRVPAEDPSAIPELIANEWFDQVTGQYLYVTTPQEGSVLLGNPNWNETQDQLILFTPGEASDSLFNIVRLHNPATGDHVYTINSNEIEFIETELNYINEGVVGRAYNIQTPGTDAIYRFNDPIAGTHAMSTDPNGFGGNFINEGIVFYA